MAVPGVWYAAWSHTDWTILLSSLSLRPQAVVDDTLAERNQAIGAEAEPDRKVICITTIAYEYLRTVSDLYRL